MLQQGTEGRSRRSQADRVASSDGVSSPSVQGTWGRTGSLECSTLNLIDESHDYHDACKQVTATFSFHHLPSLPSLSSNHFVRPTPVNVIRLVDLTLIFASRHVNTSMLVSRPEQLTLSLFRRWLTLSPSPRKCLTPSAFLPFSPPSGGSNPM